MRTTLPALLFAAVLSMAHGSAEAQHYNSYPGYGYSGISQQWGQSGFNAPGAVHTYTLPGYGYRQPGSFYYGYSSPYGSYGFGYSQPYYGPPSYGYGYGYPYYDGWPGSGGVRVYRDNSPYNRTGDYGSYWGWNLD